MTREKGTGGDRTPDTAASDTAAPETATPETTAPETATTDGYRGTIIVVHGVGDQGRGETVEALAETMGKVLDQQGLSPKVQAPQTEFFQVGDETHAIRTVRISDTQAQRVAVQACEFHWADLSSLRGNVNRMLWGLFRILVGLPKHGYAAITTVPRAGKIDDVTRFLFTTSWILIVVRLSSLSLIALIQLAKDWMNFIEVPLLSFLRNSSSAALSRALIVPAGFGSSGCAVAWFARQITASTAATGKLAAVGSFAATRIGRPFDLLTLESRVSQTIERIHEQQPSYNN